MVVKNPPISAEIAARMAAENTRQFAGDAKTKETHDNLVVRMWCVEQAVAVCGQDGVVWHAPKFNTTLKSDAAGQLSDPPDPISAVVPIAEEILRFITAENKP